MASKVVPWLHAPSPENATATRPLPSSFAAIAAPVNLLHHPLHVAALGNAMAVAAMGGDDHVLGGEMVAHADGGRLLPAIEMGEADDLAGLDLVVKALLEHPDRRHAAIGAE